ncbi:lysophospholipid acyltransferase family protein [Massilibacteroides sp.]|uniref:lysophospholipid acyltransferase family protein n=1 Tax=Massilibacteroides sp. TaxID=2034766 RepID=UPI00263512CF|nr:lysophospholipid acyltransferase family protein [Massilibacteroides sp.]MDD4516084.1 lysophospholipid acyltransferase family protein [Massilibacteroides sp.]
MLTKIEYAILFAWTKLHAMLPLKILYVLSDILYVLIYKISNYRVRVTRSNIRASFPEKTEAERRDIERRFYHHFADYIVETIKLGHISEKEVQRRAFLNNPELIDRLMDEGHPCVIMLMGHYGNWEWFTSAGSFFKDANVFQVYRPLKDKAFDNLFIYLRTRFGSKGIKKNDTIRDVITLNKNKTRSCVILISDQTPSKANLHYWTKFLNQETAVLTGGERIARKFNLPVIFADTKKKERGLYTVDFRLITDKPQETPEFWITEQYARLMEECILRDPAYWLWTHKRWKHKKKEE